MIHYRCPACQTAHASVDLMAGMMVVCKQCKQPIEVPKESTAPAPETPETPPRAEGAPPSVPTSSLPAPERAIPVPSIEAAPSSKHARWWLVPVAGVGALAILYLLWITFRTPPMRVLTAHEGAVWCVAFAPDGSTVASGGADGTLILWNAGRGRELRRFEGHTDTVSAVAFSRDGRLLLSGSFDNTVRLWEVETGELIGAYPGHQGAVLSVTLSRDNSVGVSTSVDQTIRLWDIASGKEYARIGTARSIEKLHDQTLRGLGKFPTAGATFTSVQFARDDRFLLSTNLNGIVRLWNAKGEPQRDVGAMPAPALCSAIARDGKYALVAGGPYEQAEPGDFDIVLWDIGAGSKAAVFTGHTDAVTGVALSNDGARVLSGSRDRTVRLWDVETADELARLEGHGDVVTSVALSLDGRRAASGSFDGTVRLWRLPD